MSDNKTKHNDMTLGLLSAVEEDSMVTQRTLSRKLGIALGLTNSYLKKCIDKGLVKINQVPANRYAYYLTPQGFSEKARLTSEYFKSSFSFYRKAKSDLTKLMLYCSENNMNNIILSDKSELSEIAIIISFGININIVGIVGKSKNTFINEIPIENDLNYFKDFDAIILTNISNSKARYKYLLENVSPSKIIIPEVLKLDLRSI